ncbi:unnamed protein product [Cuscuta europaea]|uniref:Uncharacterized protein n=1 Tax=Cuscuta europaea TaxID=41803 RepID=A0A9P1EKB9_CUSEU|nr:unnamed protein product [Cuscuta europaea]
MSSPESHNNFCEADEADKDDQQESHGSRHDDGLTDSNGEGYFDLPPESFCIPVVSEKDWLYQNATVLRKTSRKLVFPRDSGHGVKCSRASLNRMHSLSRIAFPATQKSRVADGNHRSNGVSLFRSQSEPVWNLAMQQQPEPASPHVTCMGRVRSRKGGVGRTGIVKWCKTVLRNRFGRSRDSS